MACKESSVYWEFLVGLLKRTVLGRSPMQVYIYSYGTEDLSPTYSIAYICFLFLNIFTYSIASVLPLVIILYYACEKVSISTKNEKPNIAYRLIIGC